MSDDRRASVVVIALLGNPFSPRYAQARARRDAYALDHCAMNVAIEAPGVSRWSLTERPASAVERRRHGVYIGPSAMERQSDGSVVVRSDERSAPWGARLRGRIRLAPERELDLDVDLDGHGRHRWSPRIPRARVDVDLEHPRLSFSGAGYLDENSGDTSLEEAFIGWSWSRVTSRDEVAIAYDVARRSEPPLAHGIRLATDGIVPLATSRVVDLGRTRFALPRTARVDENATCRVIRTLEDGPFYARSIIESGVAGGAACGVHETVSLERFASRWVQFLVPFRMRIDAA